MYKYQGPCRRVDFTNGGAWYLWVLNRKVASYHSYSAYKLEVFPRLKKTLSNPELNLTIFYKLTAAQLLKYFPAIYGTQIYRLQKYPHFFKIQFDIISVAKLRFPLCLSFRMLPVKDPRQILIIRGFITLNSST